MPVPEHCSYDVVYLYLNNVHTDLNDIKPFSYSMQLSMNIILLIHVEFVGILTFMSRIKTSSECFKQEQFLFLGYFFCAVEISYSFKLSLEKL